MLSIVNLSKYYKYNAALDTVNLEFQRGSIIGIVGPNGAGKTTLLKCITDLCTGYSGYIDKPDNMAVGLVLDNLKAYQNRTLKFNLEYFRIIKGLESYDQSLRILEKLNFDLNHVDSKLANFSYGMNQKVTTALSLMSDPDLVLLDEPFRGLDEQTIDSFKGLLSEFKMQNKLILFSSHNLSDVEQICDKVVIIHKGKVLDIIDAKVVGNSRNITFSTSNNSKTLEIISKHHPKFENDVITLTLEGSEWNEIVKMIANADIEILNVDNNSALSARVRKLFEGVK